MLYLLDTADLEAIAHFSEYYPLSGVTTNPTLISKQKTDCFKLLKSIRQIIGGNKSLHVQTTQKKASDIVNEATRIQNEVGDNFYIKIPIGEEALKATAKLVNIGIKVTMTAIFTPQQALLSAKAGASFVAPYVNRLDNVSGNGVEVVTNIVNLFNNYDLDCQVLAASFKNVQQVSECALAKCHAATISPEVLAALLKHPLTDAAINGFEKDWKSFYGDSTILDLLK